MKGLSYFNILKLIFIIYIYAKLFMIYWTKFRKTYGVPPFYLRSVPSEKSQIILMINRDNLCLTRKLKSTLLLIFFLLTIFFMYVIGMEPSLGETSFFLNHKFRIQLFPYLDSIAEIVIKYLTYYMLTLAIITTRDITYS